MFMDGMKKVVLYGYNLLSYSYCFEIKSTLHVCGCMEQTDYWKPKKEKKIILFEKSSALDHQSGYIF